MADDETPGLPERQSTVTRSWTDALALLVAGTSAFGGWISARRYWVLVALSAAAVLAKTSFKWAGTTGSGWYFEYLDVIDAWPLRERLENPGRGVWMENYSSILAFRALDAVGLPHSSFTWNLVHVAASLAAIGFLAAWAKREFGDQDGRIVLLLVLFGAAPMVLLHEIGRYDSFFFLGAVLLAVGRSWWVMVLGIVLLGTSSWTMGLGFAGSLVLAGLVLGSRGLAGRGALALLSCAFGAGLLMVVRVVQGGDPTLDRLGRLAPGGDSEGIRGIIYQVWWNVVQPFPNWIWAVLGVTWLLFAITVAQSARRRLLLSAAIIVLPVLAGATNAGDGTREMALTVTAALLAVSTVLIRRARSDWPDTGAETPRRLWLGAVAVLCLLAPVVNINPNEPLNPYGWLGLYGLSALHSVLGG